MEETQASSPTAPIGRMVALAATVFVGWFVLGAVTALAGVPFEVGSGVGLLAVALGLILLPRSGAAESKRTDVAAAEPVTRTTPAAAGRQQPDGAPPMVPLGRAATTYVTLMSAGWCTGLTALAGGLFLGVPPLIAGAAGLVGLVLIAVASRCRSAYLRERWDAQVSLAVIEVQRQGHVVDPRFVAALRDVGPARDVEEVWDDAVRRYQATGTPPSDAGDRHVWN